MTTASTVSLTTLYEQDETAWLEEMAALAAQRRHADLDYPHLSEYLSDMAKRDRREVLSRLIVLMVHLLKWDHRPDQQCGSWRRTIREQRRELRQLLESGTLRSHATAVLADAYAEARRQAADEAEVGVEVFPSDCARDLDEILGDTDA
jgi:hypothetical protein